MAKVLPHYNPELVVALDVDETLVRYNDRGVPVVHLAHVRALKEHWRRGHHVIVWSAGGGAWAKHVVNMLNLGYFVHETKAKPRWTYDDRPESIQGDSIYLYAEGFNNGRSFGSFTEVDRSRKTCSNVHFATFGSSSIIHPLPKIESVRFDIGKESHKGGNGAKPCYREEG